MSASYELFLKWKDKKNYVSIRAAALDLCGNDKTVYMWNTRGSNASADLIERMCKDLGEDPIPYIMRAFEEAAKGDAKRALSRILKNYSKSAVVIFGCVFALGIQPEAHASTQAAISLKEAAQHIHYAKLWVWVNRRKHPKLLGSD